MDVYEESELAPLDTPARGLTLSFMNIHAKLHPL